MEEHVDGKGALSASGSDHEAMDSWTFVDESRSLGQQQQSVPSGSADCQPQQTETKKDKYHLSVDQDNDTELSDGISIISDSDCGGRHTPEEPHSEAEKEIRAPPTPPDTPPLSLSVEEKRIVEVDNRLAEKEPDLVRGTFGIGRRHVMMIVLLAGISGAMFGHIFRAMPATPCDCSKLLEPLMNRVYDLEVENFRLRDEVTMLTQKILTETPLPSTEKPMKTQQPVAGDSVVQEERVWAGDRDEAIVKPLVDESICGVNTEDDLFDDYYGKICREAEQRVKDARKGFEELPGGQKSPWKEEPSRPPPRKEPERPKPKPEPSREERKPEKKERNSEERKGKPGKYQDRDDRKNSKEDRRNSKEKFDERRKRDDDWSGEEYHKREKNEKMKKGERKNYDDFKDSRERKNGDKKRDKRNGKKWRDDDDSREGRTREMDGEWQNKRMRGREQFREKESGEKNGNWYLERGSDREIKRLRTDESHESHETHR